MKDVRTVVFEKKSYVMSKCLDQDALGVEDNMANVSFCLMKITQDGLSQSLCPSTCL